MFSVINPLLAAAAWFAYMVGLIAGRSVDDLPSFALGAAGGAALVLAGYAAALRTRVISARPSSTHLRFGALAFVAGIGLGLANLGANLLITSAHPMLRELMIQRVTTLDPMLAVVGAPLREEVTFRLFLMSALAWVLSRSQKNPSIVFVSALLVSSFVFALLHLGRPVPVDPALANLYRASLVVKYTLAGLPLGWMFWRWGLPYAILCHAVSNGAHLIAQRFVF